MGGRDLRPGPGTRGFRTRRTDDPGPLRGVPAPLRVTIPGSEPPIHISIGEGGQRRVSEVSENGTRAFSFQAESRPT